MTRDKVELGRHLFYDVRLSANGAQSCATCHRQERAFTEPRVTSVGSTGEPHIRNAMSLANAAYAPRLNWADPDLARLEHQALVPLFGVHPVELGNDEASLIARISAVPGYVAQFAAAFPEIESADRISVDTLVKALAAFQRALVSADSSYDRYTLGDTTALDDDARAGLALFTSERLACSRCHTGFTLSSSSADADSNLEVFAFHNTGLYDVDGQGGYPKRDQGLFDVSEFPRDMGRFRAPTLRNIAVTAPYMHDGSIASLDEVVDHYAAGGRLITSGPDAGDGRANPFKSDLVRGFDLSSDERRQLLAFLHALTDPTFLSDPRYAPPGTP